MVRTSRWVLLSFLLIAPACNRAQPPGAATSTATAAGPQRPDTAQARAIIATIVLCRTTEAELRTRLGPPNRDGVLHGERIVTWFVRTDSPASFLSVLLDSAGVVVDDYWDVPAEAPVVLESQCDQERE
jgi:hypothetical protein